MQNRNSFMLVEILAYLLFVVLVAGGTIVTILVLKNQTRPTETKNRPGPERQAESTQQPGEQPRLEELGIHQQCGAVKQTAALSNEVVESHFGGPLSNDPVSYINTNIYAIKVRAEV